MTCICVDTLASLGTAVIPADVQSVVVAQFNLTSAVSDAVYIRATGDPGHPLSVYNSESSTSGWWTIHPDYLTLEAAGAPASVTADCAPAMQNVLLYLAAVTCATLKLGTRDYTLSYAATLTQNDPDNDPLLYFPVAGQGPRVSRLLIPAPSGEPGSPLGAFAIVFSSNESGFEAREFSVIATGATSAGSGCGTAILVNFPGLTGTDAPHSPGNHRGALLCHVEVCNDDNEIGGVSWSYFTTGIDLTGAGWALISDVVITGPSGTSNFTTSQCGEDPPLVGYLADESPAFLPTCHLVINNCYGPTLTGLKLVCAQIGISHVTVGITPGDQGPQELHMSNIHIDSVKTCVVHSQIDTCGHSVDCPVGMIQNSYFEFRDVGLDLSNILKWQIHGCDFYNAGDTLGLNVGGDCLAGTVFDIHLRSANIVNVSGCRFNRSGAAKRFHIYVDGDDTAISHPAFAKNVLLADNIFGDDLGGIDGISAIVVSPSAKNVVIGVNAYVGDYSGSIVDDQTTTGQATAPLGVPSTSTSKPPAIVPNAYAENISPTAGSVTVPWQNTISNLHTIPNSAAPSAPASGWALYAVGDTLYAIYQNGAKIPIVSA